MADDEQARTNGAIPAFLKKALLTPSTGLGVLAVLGLSSIPPWHLHGPNVGAMASVLPHGGRSTTASNDRPEAPDPTATPFPHRDVPQRAVLARYVAQVRPQPSPSANTNVRNTNVAIAQSAAVAVTVAPVAPPAAHSDFGAPSDMQPVAAPPMPVATDNGGVGYVSAVSKYELQEGAVIHCRWVTHVDSESIGHVTAMTIEPVYASANPSVLLIPSGSAIEGWYRTASLGQTRLLVSWHRIEFPNGRKFEMGDEPATDELGGTGANARVNSGLGKSYGQAALATLLTLPAQALSRATNIQFGVSPIQPQQVKPVLYVDPAKRVNINVVRDLPLERYEAQR